MAPLSVKLRLLKNLMESQFDSNEKFKKEVNNKSAKELRMTPLGTDKLGNAYWYHMDPKDAAVRVYKDDPDEETWELAAETEAELQVCPLIQLYPACFLIIDRQPMTLQRDIALFYFSQQLSHLSPEPLKGFLS